MFCDASPGPVKYALLPQHLRDDELLAGNAYIEAGTFLAILLAADTLIPGMHKLAELLMAKLVTQCERMMKSNLLPVLLRVVELV